MITVVEIPEYSYNRFYHVIQLLKLSGYRIHYFKEGYSTHTKYTFKQYDGGLNSLKSYIIFEDFPSLVFTSLIIPKYEKMLVISYSVFIFEYYFNKLEF